MPEETNILVDALIPPPAIHADAQIFSDRVRGLLDGQPKDEATVARALTGLDAMFEVIAAGMYSMASMLVGEGEDSIRLVETAVANTEILGTNQFAEDRRNSRLALCAAALDILTARNPASLAAPLGLEHAATCIADDELDAAGVSSRELEQMLTGPERDRVRTWLEGLPTVLRTVFVLRAVAGLSTQDAASLLAAHGGPEAYGWTAEAVGELSRQSLCSLASQVLHASHQ